MPRGGGGRGGGGALRGGGGFGSAPKSSPVSSSKTASSAPAKQQAPPPASPPAPGPPASTGVGAAMAGGLARGVGMGVGMSMTQRLMDSIKFRPFEWPSDAIFMSLGAAAGCGILAAKRRFSNAHARALAPRLLPPRTGPRATYIWVGAGGALGGMFTNSYRIALPPGWERLTDPSSSQTYYAHSSGLTQWEKPC